MSNVLTDTPNGDRAKLQELFARYEEEAPSGPRSDVTLEQIVAAIRSDREDAH